MRILAIHAHPTPDSFNADLHRAVIARLSEAHEVDNCDLYAERLDPVIGADDFRAYMDEKVPAAIEPHAQRLRKARALLFMFPTWNYGLPAILKGYFDRVWRPGVSFELKNHRPHPILRHITHLAVVTTYGSPWAYNKLFMFEPNKRVFMRGFGTMLAPRLQKLWLAQYSEDRISDAERQAFMRKACDETRAWADRPAL
jgi:putative NADPH-quinone reductase